MCTTNNMLVVSIRKLRIKFLSKLNFLKAFTESCPHNIYVVANIIQ